MRSRGLMLALSVASGLFAVVKPAEALPLLAPSVASAHALVVPAFHPGRATSFYCYPRNYWWFYRPYTTAAEGFQRCMPYFHYPQGPRRGRADGLK